MGGVSFWIGRAIDCFVGREVLPLPPGQVRVFDGDGGTSNKIAMAITTELHRTRGEGADGERAMERSEQLLDSWERDGLWCADGRCEQMAPSPHGGMHLLALMALLDVSLGAAHSSRLWRIGQRALRIAGALYNLFAVCSTPDGAVFCPGMRADDGPYNGFAIEYDAWFREAAGLPHRGASWRTRSLENLQEVEDLSGLNGGFYGPALWLKKLLAGPHGEELSQVLMFSPWLPKPKLRLAMTVWTWPGGRAAAIDDPGEGMRENYRADGSAQARAEGDPEDVTSALRVDFGEPGMHAFSWVLTWAAGPPAVPDGAVMQRFGDVAFPPLLLPPPPPPPPPPTEPELPLWPVVRRQAHFVARNAQELAEETSEGRRGVDRAQFAINRAREGLDRAVRALAGKTPPGGDG